MFTWRESFSCNITEIDNQHKKLFEIGSRLHQIATLKDEYDHYDEIINILEELKEYTEYHFSYEENLMEENGFVGYDMHKVEHDFFIKKIKKLSGMDVDEKQGESIMQMITFVADWISSHILKTDMQYKSYLNSKGVC